MNVAGIIDAVVTEDSDAFLFGALTVFRKWVFCPIYNIGILILKKRHPHGDNPCYYVNSISSDDIQSNLNMTRTDFLLLAVLAGGDYNKVILNSMPTQYRH